MDAFYERLAVRAATLDEVLSDDFEPLPGQKGDADLAAQRLAAWCRSSASGDWSLFGRRLDRDGLAFAPVLARLAAVRRTAAALPPWIEDAIWIEAALQDTDGNATPLAVSDNTDPCAFEQLFTSLVAQADTRLWSGLDTGVGDNLNEAARASLRLALLRELSSLGTAALYERFAKARNAASPQHDAAGPAQHNGTARYDRFIAEMQAGGWRRLFEDKPVLLRLLATMTRQWIDTSREMVLRLDADLAAIRRDILLTANAGRVAGFEGNLSDPHNEGRSVRIVSFENGARIVYKPKDLRLDAAWHALVERLNGAQAPIELKAVRAIAQDGYGWTEFIDHAACADEEDFARFFRRAGGWLALFHCFAATDMHQENIIACGDHPVPIDLEMILQAGAEERSAEAPEDFAFAAAAEIVSNSVTAVGLLPAYGRSPDNIVFAIGGMTADWNAKTEIVWDKINSDAMRPAKSNQAAKTSPNLPHVDGRNAKFGDHVDDFVAGFEQYANFLLRRGRGAGPSELFDGFAGVPVRNVIRATRFYYMLLQRLRNHKSMDDGVIWSAQADFIARLSDWQSEHNPLWPLQRAERSALVALNVPHFVSPSDGHDISDANGNSVHIALPSGLDRARARFANFDEREIAWQTEVIRENTNSIPRSAVPKAAELQRNCASRNRTQRFRNRADKRDFHRRSRSDRGGIVALRHSPRPERRLDRSRLAGRFRVFPARLPRSGPLQRHLRHRCLSCRPCGGDRQQSFGRACLCRAGAIAQEFEKPQCGAHDPGARCRWRRRTRLDRLRAVRHGEMPARRSACSRMPGRRRNCSPTTSLPRTSNWTLSAAVPAASSACCGFIATRDPTTCCAAQRNAASTCSASLGSDRKGSGPGSARAPDRAGSTACRTARRALPLR